MIELSTPLSRGTQTTMLAKATADSPRGVQDWFSKPGAVLCSSCGNRRGDQPSHAANSQEDRAEEGRRSARRHNANSFGVRFESCVTLANNTHCGCSTDDVRSAFRPGASELPGYCTPVVCVLNVVGVSGVAPYKQTNKQTKSIMGASGGNSQQIRVLIQDLTSTEHDKLF